MALSVAAAPAAALLLLGAVGGPIAATLPGDVRPWTGGDLPYGAASPMSLLLLGGLATIVLLTVALSFLAATLTTAGNRADRISVAVLSAVSTATSALSLLALAHVAVAHAGPPTGLPWWTWAGGAAAAGIGAAGSWALFPVRDELPPSGRITPLPVIAEPRQVPADAPEDLTWSGTARMEPAALRGFGLSVIVIVMVEIAAGAAGLGTLAAAIAIPFILFMVAPLAYARVTVRVSPSGVRFGGIGGLFGRTVPMREIRAARVVRTGTPDWGGYGRRIDARGEGLIVREGEALLLERLGDDVVVSLDDAAGAACVVTHHVRRMRGA